MKTSCHAVEQGQGCRLYGMKQPGPRCQEVGCCLRAVYAEDGRHRHPADKRYRRFEHRHIGEVRT